MLAPARYRPVTYEEVPELRKALRRVEDPFRASDIIPHLPVSMRDYEPRELGRALIYRGVAERTGDGRLRRRHEDDQVDSRRALPRLQEREGDQGLGEVEGVLPGLLGGVEVREAEGGAASTPRERFQILEESINMGRKKTTETSESKTEITCKDCDHNHSAICENCRGMDHYEGDGDVMSTPIIHEDGTIEGEIANPEALDALEKCKHHGEKIDAKDGVAFCRECGLALACDDCDDADEVTRCHDCTGQPRTGIAGDLYKPKGTTTPPESGELAPSAEEPNWDTYHDRAADAPDPMMEEAMGEPQTVTETPEEQALVPVRPDEPWWSGGPLDTVDGMPWNIAVLRVPKDSYMMLLPGKYNYGGMEAELTKPLRLDGENGPYEPDVIVQNILLYSEQEGKDKAEESSRVEYRGGASGQSTLGGEPMIRGSIERRPVVQVKVEVDKFRLTTTEEGLDNSRELEKSELEQWVYHKMKPLSKDTYVSGTDWPEGCRQIMAVIKGAA